MRSYRLDEDTINNINLLCQYYGISQSKLIEKLIKVEMMCSKMDIDSLNDYRQGLGLYYPIKKGS